MAARKTTTAKAATAEAKVETEATPVEKPKQTRKPVAEKVVEAEKKIFESDDPIRCVSITSGGLFMEGIKSGILYSWVDAGDTADVEYADLVAEIRKKGMYIFRPRFVVEDEDFIKEFPELDTLYAKLYTQNDLKEILKLNPEKMREVITQLPDGAKDSIKSIAVTAIERGEMDSVNRIKVIDEVFGTNMLIKMTN